MKNVVIFDLDGTLSLLDHRRHLVERKPADWDAFYEACDKDAPNVPVITVAQALHATGFEIWIVSGRSEAVRTKTEKWLAKECVFYAHLVMRPERDFTPDHDLKLHWLTTLIPRERVAMVFDDRAKVVQMWRQQGLTCLQVAEGNF